ncbi:hypothetical protein BDR05DRAFT_964636 [Suillus weaverae]|nr:hypothetical protein BDR05DRAFT_964636 [Suillus weaverae]
MYWMAKHNIKTTCTWNRAFASRPKKVQLGMSHPWSSIGDVNGASYHSVGPPSSTTILELRSGRKQLQELHQEARRRSGSSTPCLYETSHALALVDNVSVSNDSLIRQWTRIGEPDSWRGLEFCRRSDNPSNSVSSDTFCKAIHSRPARRNCSVRMTVRPIIQCNQVALKQGHKHLKYDKSRHKHKAQSVERMYEGVSCCGFFFVRRRRTSHQS